MKSLSALLARQPIFDRDVRVAGYEILFRTCEGGSIGDISPEHATAEVGVNALLDVGLDKLAGERKVWINIPRATLVNGTYRFFPQDRVVLELLESIVADPEVLAALDGARDLGFQIALDDFVLGERTQALVGLADYVKLDRLALGEDGLRAAVAALRRPGLKLLAEKVETHEAFRHARDLGCDLFQGYFFAKPQLVGLRRVPSNRLSLMRVVCGLEDAQASLEQVEGLVRSDVGLSYRLMRYVNSAAVGAITPIESIRHAIMTLGFDRVRACVLVLIVTAGDDKPDELVATSLVRARYCQLLCPFAGLDPQRGFLVGLLSVIDAFLDRKLDLIVDELGLADDVARALLRREGPLGTVLETAIACESADWERARALPLDTRILRESYLDALRWSAMLQASIGT